MADVNRTDLPPLIRAGIAHAQFETWRHVGAADDPSRDHAAELWLGTLLEATHNACQEAHRYLDAVSELDADMRAQAGPVQRRIVR